MTEYKQGQNCSERKKFILWEDYEVPKHLLPWNPLISRKALPWTSATYYVRTLKLPLEL